MSSAGISLTENCLSPADLQPSDGQREIMLQDRLAALREIALSLLSELETLGRASPAPLGNISLDDEVKRFEIDLIRAALAKAGGNQACAARMLGVKHTTLNAKIKRYGIQPLNGDVSALLSDARHELAA